MTRIKNIEGVRKVRANSLNVGVEYLILEWSRKKEKEKPIPAVYIGFGSDIGNLEEVVPKLNTIENKSLFFSVSGKTIGLPISKCIAWNENKTKRVTFGYDERAYRPSGALNHKSKTELKTENKITKNKNKAISDMEADYLKFDADIKTNPEYFEIAEYNEVTHFHNLIKENFPGITKDNAGDILNIMKDDYGVPCFYKQSPHNIDYIFRIEEYTQHKEITKYYSSLKNSTKVNYEILMQINDLMFKKFLSYQGRESIIPIVENIDINRIDFVSQSGKELNISEEVKNLLYFAFLSISEQAYGKVYYDLFHKKELVTSVKILDEYINLFESM